MIGNYRMTKSEYYLSLCAIVVIYSIIFAICYMVTGIIAYKLLAVICSYIFMAVVLIDTLRKKPII